jgi:N-acetylglucosamine kinase-like BadF-type ATPase
MALPELLGIDGGGTATKAWLADAEGHLLGRGRGGPSNIKAVGAAAALRALQAAIAGAFADAREDFNTVEVACLGLAGFDRPEDKEQLRTWAADGRWAKRLILVNDGDLVVAAGTPKGWGLGVIAGTGSIAVGRSPTGTTARAGGWGPLIGDEGSAYALALAGLRLVARMADGRDPPTGIGAVLTDRLCGAMGIGGPEQLVAALYHPSMDRAAIAALAPVIVAAASEDARITAQLLEPAGRDLAELVLAVAQKLGWWEWDDETSLPLALAGGFLLSAPPVAETLIRHLEQLGFQVAPEIVPEPVAGAVRLAQRALHS